jgi:hypothetical protein
MEALATRIRMQQAMILLHQLGHLTPNETNKCTSQTPSEARGCDVCQRATFITGKYKMNPLRIGPELLCLPYP